jgi:nucleoside 2-deoxyribosyltransferase
MKVYVASSWNNEVYPEVVEALRQAGHDVYDFRHQGGSDSNPTEMPSDQLLDFLDEPKVRSIFKNDMDALVDSDAVVCVLPCGRSAHLELGYGIGAGKRTVLLWHDGDAPDIMHKAVDAIVFSVDEIPGALTGN